MAAKAAPAGPGSGIGVLQRKCACGGSKGLEGECAECQKQPLQRRAHAGGRPPATLPPAVGQVLRSEGRPLDPSTRAFMEPRFGHDFGRIRVHPGLAPANGIVPESHASEEEAERLSESIVRANAGTSPVDLSRIRVHADNAAAESARAVDALAYTAGRHIVFAAGKYRPETAQGRRLLAHELVHTVQQTGAAVVQRQGKPADAPILAREIFPYPEKSRLLVNLLLPEEKLTMLARLSEGDPDTALAVKILRAAEAQIATVTAAKDDLFEALIPSVTLPAEDKTPARTINNVTLRFSRQADNKFRIALAADTGSGVREIYVKSNLPVSKDGGEYRLEISDAVEGKIGPGGKPGELEISGELGGLFTVEALRLTKLPDAPPGSEKEKKFVQDATKAAREERRDRKQQLTAGVGVAVSAGKVDPVFTASWRTSFTPFVKLGDVVNIPMRVQLDYAPDISVTGAVTSGVGISIPSKIPVNVRVDLGVAGGAVRGEATAAGGKGPVRAGFGPTFGAGVGVNLGKTFRAEVDYERLQNVVHNSPNVSTVTLGVGGAF
jgi:hypothetical protein